MPVKRSRLLRPVTLLATLLLVAASPSPSAAQIGPDLDPDLDLDLDLDEATVCASGLVVGPPPDTSRVTWEYAPPIQSQDARLACASPRIAELLDLAPGAWGLAVRDMRTGETLLVNPDRHFVAGSLYKLGVAAEAYARIDASSLAEESLVVVSGQDVDPEYGGSRYTEGTYLSVRQAVQAMLTQSDNGAALALVDRLGLNAVNRRFDLLDMPDTRLVYDAVTTPRDVLSFFTMLADGDVVSVAASDNLIDLLAAQEINDRIPAGLPVGEGWRVAHKTANIDDMLGDAGIVYTPTDGAFVLVILNQGLTSYWTAVQTIRSISQSVYRAIVPLPIYPDAYLMARSR